MPELVIAAVLFVATHFVMSWGPLRARLVTGLGEKPFLAFYSIVSIAALAWMVVAYGAAPRDLVWQPIIGLRHQALTVMALAWLLIVAGFTTPGPTAMPLGPGPADMRPKGILTITRHPAMWGAALFAASHVLANGHGAGIVFFGAFGILALLGAAHIDARRAATLGADWAAYAQRTAFVPFAAAGRTPIDWAGIGWLRLLAGLAVYGLFLWFHETLFGVDPRPDF